jgi:hypothetical protein
MSESEGDYATELNMFDTVNVDRTLKKDSEPNATLSGRSKLTSFLVLLSVTAETNFVATTKGAGSVLFSSPVHSKPVDLGSGLINYIDAKADVIKIFFYL